MLVGEHRRERLALPRHEKRTALYDLLDEEDRQRLEPRQFYLCDCERSVSLQTAAQDYGAAGRAALVAYRARPASLVAPRGPDAW
jgi:hypothetical protein